MVEREEVEGEKVRGRRREKRHTQRLFYLMAHSPNAHDR